MSNDTIALADNISLNTTIEKLTKRLNRAVSETNTWRKKYYDLLAAYNRLNAIDNNVNLNINDAGEQVVALVQNFYKIDLLHTSDIRLKRYVCARYVVMYYCNVKLNMSLSEASRYVNKDHASTLHAITYIQHAQWLAKQTKHLQVNDATMLKCIEYVDEQMQNIVPSDCQN